MPVHVDCHMRTHNVHIQGFLNLYATIVIKDLQ